MGHLLDKPKTDKLTESSAVENEPQRLAFAASSMQGWRVEMEDAHCIQLNFDGDIPGHHFVGVFDGHGGTRTSQWMAENLLSCIVETDEFEQYRRSAMSGSPDLEILEAALKRGFIAADAKFQPILDAENPHDTSGSTAVCCLITPGHILCANAGDSRAVMAVGIDKSTDGNDFVALSEDHKPDNPDERDRIERAGGTVSMKRVDGDLAVSRAFGDYKFKLRDDLGPEEQRVTALPDVVIRQRKSTDEWLLLACDGVWDVMSSGDGVGYVRHLAVDLGESDIELIAEEVLDKGLELNSQDNMTALVVQFPAGAQALGSGGGVQSIREAREKATKDKEDAAREDGRTMLTPMEPMDMSGGASGHGELN